MSALERAFERARALNVDLVELAARIERDGSGATASASAREGTLLDALDALARGERALGEGNWRPGSSATGAGRRRARARGRGRCWTRWTRWRGASARWARGTTIAR